MNETKRAVAKRAPAKLTARGVALAALMHGGFAAEDLDRELRAASLGPTDRGFATELAYGTLKMRRALIWSVSRHLSRPFESLDERLKWVILLGAYQLLYLDRVPAHSAVDEAVTLARAGGHPGIAGFANAVLRKVAADKARPPVPTPADGAVALGIYASLPDWIAAQLIARFGFDDALRAADGMNGAPRRAFRIDGSPVERERLMEVVVGAVDLHGRPPRPSQANDTSRSSPDGLNENRYQIPECLVVVGAANETLREAIASGRVVRQSEESQLAVHLLDPKPGEVVLDACCGRGVKTSMIASRLAGEGTVWALDDDEQKLSALRDTVQRKEWKNVRVLRADARETYPTEVPTQVDAALVDAPCSGLGVLGRRPDARWRKREHDPARFARVQAAILRTAAQRVRPGGRLQYVTCTTPAEEDEAIVDAFLGENAEWSAADLPLTASSGVRKIGKYALTVPGIDGADGFFYALLHNSKM
ncbi:MAG TPA: transcription antitermination factor NusB [Candidatus Eremiobacteraceae bacterium]|nr:transcription antitermination factor NusB [Candidatus Eremiobacteraceae bacterium]